MNDKVVLTVINGPAAAPDVEGVVGGGGGGGADRSRRCAATKWGLVGWAYWHYHYQYY